jgi:hypothetical protein
LFKAGRAIAVLCAVALSLAGALGAGASVAAAADLTATVSGTLVAGGVLTGAAAVSLASESGGGVRSAAITVDGVQLASASGSAIWLDTGLVRDGTHFVTVTMTDIVGDSGQVWSGLVQTLNAPRGGAASILGQAQEGQTLVADTASWSPQPTALTYQWQRCDSAGGSCSAIAGADAAAYTPTAVDDYGQLAVIVTASDTGGSNSASSSGSGVVLDAQGAASPPALAAPLGAALVPAAARTPAGGSSATVVPPSASGAANGSSGAGACREARLRATFAGAPRVTIAFGRRVTLRGSLRCGAVPLKRALLRVVLTPAAGDAPARRAQIRTRADGSFAFAVGPGPSRRIEVSYGASAGRRVAAASASASVVVTPEISLEITPTLTTNGHTITFTGQVSGGDEPPGGLPLQLEYREGSRWMLYQVVRADPRNGRFLYRYTFERTTRSITYTFRFATPSSGVPGYPFAPAVSPPRSVHVDP